MGVSRSAYYECYNLNGKLIDAQQLHIFLRAKSVVSKISQSLRRREMRENFGGEGFIVGLYSVRKLMDKLGLYFTQCVACRVTSKCKYTNVVAERLLNQNFIPLEPN